MRGEDFITEKYSKRNPKIIIRYALFQIPSLMILNLVYLIIIDFAEIKSEYFLIFIALWIIKDISLYPVVWKSYIPKRSSPDELLLGRTGVVREALRPIGFVSVRGELWKAALTDESLEVNAGDKVVIESVNGLQLRVKPLAAKGQDRNRTH